MNANPLSHAIYRALSCYVAADNGVFCLVATLPEGECSVYLRLP